MLLKFNVKLTFILKENETIFRISTFDSMCAYIYIHVVTPTRGPRFCIFIHKLMCGTRLRIAPLQFLKWPPCPPCVSSIFWKHNIKEAPERTTPKVNEWPHFWPFFLPETQSTARGGAVHSLTSSRRPFLVHFLQPFFSSQIPTFSVFSTA